MLYKRVLIISPYFSPANAADIHRVRTSLRYFKNYGWQAEIVTVDLNYVDIITDDLLKVSTPPDIIIHKVKAFSKKITSKFGLGSIALRSLWFYKQKVNQLLTGNHYDLIYFSTTQFPVCILGAYWKKRFGIPYVIDMQDPWHSDYYLDKPSQQRPAKFWFSYRLNKYLEPIALRNVDALISVSEQYITDLKKRYPALQNIPSAIITFGTFEPDMAIATQYQNSFPRLINKKDINLVYVGRGGVDMHKAIIPLLTILQKNLINDPAKYANLKLYFIGTSYAAAGQGKLSILPLAERYGLGDHIIELTDRISYYHTLTILQQADALFIPGSDDPKYTASKIYPYLLSKKPILTILHPDSPAHNMLSEIGAKYTYSFNDYDLAKHIKMFLNGIIGKTIITQDYDSLALQKYSADNLTGQQCSIFDLAINRTHIIAGEKL